jgi:hemolysin activation/secretion protein/AraC-like DNA-binding protein
LSVERHFVLQELTLLPSGEWFPRADAWLMVRIDGGSGYWLHRGTAAPLNPGDVLAATPQSGGVIRASGIGPIKLHFYSVSPVQLSGFLSARDVQILKPGGPGASAQALIYSAQQAVSRNFADVTMGGTQPGLTFKTRLLMLWIEAVAGLASATSEQTGDALRDQFRALLSRVTEADLALGSLTELAQQIHCSERHFSRLFKMEFATPFRSHQTELRLSRACQMLSGSNNKIINVAYESGYRHLGLFNAMFKKRFGMTPSQWRARYRKSSHRKRSRFLEHACLVSAFVWLTFGALAQTNTAPAATNAVSAATNPAAAATNAAPKFEVRNYEVHGNTILNRATIDGIFESAKGKEVTLEQIRKALANLQTAYRERGYPSVSVTLPQQQLTNAVVTVQVTEAPLTSITVVNNGYFSSNNIMRALPSLKAVQTYSNVVLNSLIFQRELGVANGNRDRQIYPVLGPGPEPRTSELTLKVKDRLPLHARFELNNQYTPGTPEFRMNANAQYNNLWQLEHQLGVQYSFTPEEFKENTMHNATFFDDPLIANYSGFYRIPLGDVTPVEEQIASNPLGFGYNEATHQFQLPPTTGRPELTFYGSRSTTDTGVKFGPRKNVTKTSFITIDSQDSGEDLDLNEALGGRMSVPLREWAGLRSTFSFGLDFKRFRLSSFNTNNFYITTVITNSGGSQTIQNTVSSGQPTREAAVDYLPFNAALDLSRNDPFGVNYFNAGVNFNVLYPESSSGGGTFLSPDADFAHAAYSTNAHAQYISVNAGYNREHNIYHDWTVLLRANGQWANGPLIGNEQFAMGGLAGVRGYLDGEAYGDSGWRVLFEPRTPLTNIGLVDNTEPFWMRGSVFMDYGELYRADASAGAKKAKFWGAGLAITAAIGDHFDARVAAAWPLLDGTTVTKGEMHLYFAMAAQF